MIFSVSEAVSRIKTYVNHKPPAKKVEFVAVGGLSMLMIGARDEIHDADVYCNDDATISTYRKLEHEDVDMTADDYLWGQIRVSDVLSSSSIVYEDTHMRLKSVSVETLFILKADSAREKDIEDLEKLVPLTTPEAICRRMGELRGCNAYNSFRLSAENLVAELQAQYMMVPEAEWITSLNLEPSDEENLLASFQLTAGKKNILRRAL